MSLAIWPRVSREELESKAAETLQRELAWIVGETLVACRELKHGLEDCYALLAPVDPGSTLVMSTPRHETVKGTMTRVGTCIVKASLSLQLRTLPAQTVALAPAAPIHMAALDALHVRLTQSIDVLALMLASEPAPAPAAPDLASTLALVADSLAESAALLKGPSLAAPDVAWQTSSCPPHHFAPPLPPNLSFHVGLQDSCVVLSLRAIEPARAPVRFGTKLGLVIGTVRRLEHDEMDLVFPFRPLGDGTADSRSGPAGQMRRRQQQQPPQGQHATLRPPASGGPPESADKDVQVQEVYVREKVRVESADPSLISLDSKLGYLSHMLGQTRSNLAAVMRAVGLDE